MNHKPQTSRSNNYNNGNFNEYNDENYEVVVILMNMTVKIMEFSYPCVSFYLQCECICVLCRGLQRVGPGL